MSLFHELKRRNVFKVAIAYAIAAWILIEITATTFPILKLPDWSVTLVTVLVLIAFPLTLILAWAFELTPEGIKKEKDVDRSESITHVTGRKLDFAIIGAMAIAIIFLLTDKFIFSESPKASDEEITATGQSIAVLPFVNISSDKEQEYFSDGITEDIITALSKFRWFFVIARNSSFTYKHRAINVKQMGRELGVRYVLEGSVRKAGDRVRITAQLIEAETGNHLWAERYDRNLEDIFELQDEITQTISAAIEPELFSSEHDRALRKPTGDLTAWDIFQQGVALLWKRDRANIESAIKLFRQAVDLDPNFGQASGYLAYAGYLLVILEWAEDRDAILHQGIADAQHAIAIDWRDYFAQLALGHLYTIAGDHLAAIRALETSVAINPNFALGYYGLAEAHVYAGDPNRAIEYADKSIRLSPNDPFMWAMLHYKASAYVRLRDYDQAIEIFEKACQFPHARYVPFATLAALYVLVGRGLDARKTLGNARRLEPNLSIGLMARIYSFSQKGASKRGHWLLDALRKAGLPD